MLCSVSGHQVSLSTKLVWGFSRHWITSLVFMIRSSWESYIIQMQAGTDSKHRWIFKVMTHITSHIHDLIKPQNHRMSLQSLGTDCCVLATTCYPAAGGCLDPFWQVLPCAAVASGACVPGTCNAGADWRGALVMSHVSSSQWSWALHNALRSRAVTFIHLCSSPFLLLTYSY